VTNEVGQRLQMNLLVHRFEGMQHMGLGALLNATPIFDNFILN
jgi:hypothetical protein